MRNNMKQALTIEKLKALLPCDDKYSDMFGDHESMNIEQAFDAGFTISNICWLMGALDKRKEIVSFANFCAKQADDAYAADNAAANDADDAAFDALTAFDNAAAARAAVRATVAAEAAYWDTADIRKEQKQFLMELLK